MGTPFDPYVPEPGRGLWLEPMGPGPLALEIAAGFAAAALTALLVVGLGLALLRLPPLRDGLLHPLRTGLATALGSAALSAALLALALTGGVAGLRLRGLLVVVTLAALHGLRRAPPLGRRPGDALPAGWRLVLVVMALPVLLRAALPSTDWDGESYHLPVAYRLLEGKLQAVLHPAHYDFPGAVHLVYAALLDFDLERAILPLNAVAVLGLLAFARAAGSHLFDERVGRLALAVLGSVGILWPLASDPRIDNFQALFTSLAGMLAIAFARTPSISALAVGSGVAVGLAIGTKYTGVLAAAALAWIAWGLWRRPRRALALGLATAVLVVVPHGYWYARNALQVGSATYPFPDTWAYVDDAGQQRLLSSWVWVYARTEAQREPWPPWAELPRLRPKFWDLPTIVLKPHLYEQKPDGAFLGPFVLLPFVLLFWPWRRAALPVHALALLICVPPVLTPNTNLRYLVPAAPFLALSAALATAALPWARLRALLCCGLFASWAWSSAGEWRVAMAQQPLSYLSGRESRIEWLGRVGWNGAISMPRFAAWADTAVLVGRLRPDEVVYMIGESKGRLLPLPFLPDESFDARRLWSDFARSEGDLGALRQEFRQRGIRLVLVNRGYLEWTASTTGVTGTALTALRLANRLQEGSEVLYDEDGTVLFRLP